MVLASLMPILFSESIFVNFSLVLLGVGWNFCYSSGSTLIAELNGSNKIKIQGLNETCIALFATLGAFFSAPVLTYLGWVNTNLFSMIFGFLMIIIIFFLKEVRKEVTYEGN